MVVQISKVREPPPQGIADVLIDPFAVIQVIGIDELMFEAFTPDHVGQWTDSPVVTGASELGFW